MDGMVFGWMDGWMFQHFPTHWNGWNGWNGSIPPIFSDHSAMQTMHLKTIHCRAVKVLRLQWLRTILADQPVDVSRVERVESSSNRNSSDQISPERTHKFLPASTTLQHLSSLEMKRVVLTDIWRQLGTWHPIA